MDGLWAPSHGRRACGGCGPAVKTSSATNAEYSVSCTTFNILAPIYKRLDKEDQSCRESQYKAYWLSRNRRILDRLLGEKSSIICLQEVWVGNEELVGLYEKTLDDAGYVSFKLARTNNRGDGHSYDNTLPIHEHIKPKNSPRIFQILMFAWCPWRSSSSLINSQFHQSPVERNPLDKSGLMTALHRDYFRVLNYRELLFNDFGDRVAQLLHVESVVPFWQSRHRNIQQEVLIVNTHLLFPHDYRLCFVRLHQVYKILQYVESYQKEHELNPMPIILCGDWNGSKRGRVYKFLRSQGFVSSYDTAHQYTDSDADAHKWVSHRNHRGNICGVDFIWLLNPNKSRKPLKTSWNEAVFGIIKYFLREASLSEENSFAFLKAGSDGDCITYSSFRQALCRLHLSGHPCGLSSEEIQDLWTQADVDGNGLIEYAEFQQRIWNQDCTEPTEEAAGEGSGGGGAESLSIGFDVKNAALFPPEAEKGMWPENYSLSDHAPLTVVFSPVRVPCSQPIC